MTHETTIAVGLIEAAKAQGEVTKVNIEVGQLAHVPAEDFKRTMQTLVEWEVNVTETLAEVKCSCGFQGEPKVIEHAHDIAIFECPKCGELPEILSGTDIILKDVEVR